MNAIFSEMVERLDNAELCELTRQLQGYANVCGVMELLLGVALMEQAERFVQHVKNLKDES